MEQKKTIKHPSFATACFYRVSGSRPNLLDSDIDHNTFIRLEIRDAELVRDTNLHTDRVFSRLKPYVEVEMSELQFAKLITSMNVGGGTPCTYRSKNGEDIPNWIREKKIDNFDKELKDASTAFVKDLQEIADSVKELKDKGKATKTELAEVLGALNHVTGILTGNLPFLVRQFHESMNEIAEDFEASAKGKIIQTINDMGIVNLNKNSALVTEADPVLLID